MTSLSALELLGVDQLTNPMTFRYSLTAPWGETEQTISVDVSGVPITDDVIGRLGPILWANVVAPATSFGVAMTRCTCRVWKGSILPIVSESPPIPGQLFGAVAPRDDSACLMLHSGHHDGYAMQPMYFPGIPARWVDDRLLNVNGRRGMEFQAGAMAVALQSFFLGGAMQQLLVFDRLASRGLEGVGEVAFRRVAYIRVLHHTERAPDPPS